MAQRRGKHLRASGLRVLVVEDQEDCAQSMAQLLTLWGHRPEVAPDGQTALASAPRFGPDVVLLDLQLPDISGQLVARRLRELALRKPPFIVAVTASAADNGLASGIDLHLVKPCEPELLKNLLRRVQEVVQSG